jgi:hypothetical protein
MKNRTVLLAVIRLVALGALAGTLTAEETAKEADAPKPPVVTLSSSSLFTVRYAAGVQVVTVPDVDSNTFGVHVSGLVEGTLPSGVYLEMDGDIFLDYDQDHLDPHHTPIWTMVHLGLSDPIAESKTPGAWHFSWVGDVNTTLNTGGIELDFKATPGVAAGVKWGILSLGAKLGVGYFMLEMDDDVPRERGYGRDDLRNHAWAISPALNATLQFTPHFKLTGWAQEWHDGGTWLETKYFAALDWDLSRIIPHADLLLSVETTQYNLSPYAPTNPPPGYLPILPWDDERLIKLSVDVKW